MKAFIDFEGEQYDLSKLKGRTLVVEKQPIDVTQCGLFGAVPDTTSRFIPGPTRYFLDGQEIQDEALMALLRVVK